MIHNLEELEAFARQYHTDKQQAQNAYLPLYLEYFRRQGIFRSGPWEILEIGTNKGSSLRLWAEYFPHARVYGLDITRTYENASLLKHDRIKTAIADQGDPAALKEALWMKFNKLHPCIHTAQPLEERLFDIIIDDGSHEQTHQQVSLGYLWTFLRPGGLYVVEDLITGENWWDGNTYNVHRVKPTREILMEFEQSGQLECPTMEGFEVEQINKTAEYCEYRESNASLHGHRPQLAFLGKKKDG